MLQTMLHILKNSEEHKKTTCMMFSDHTGYNKHLCEHTCPTHAVTALVLQTVCETQLFCCTQRRGPSQTWEVMKFKTRTLQQVESMNWPQLKLDQSVICANPQILPFHHDKPLPPPYKICHYSTAVELCGIFGTDLNLKLEWKDVGFRLTK